jgi:hypothetical protein
VNKVFNILKEVIEDKRLTYLDKTVFTSLITFNGKNKIFPSLSDIGNRINCNSINNISVSINKLKELNYIDVIRRFQKSNIYILKNVTTDLKIKKKNERKPESIESIKNKSILYSVVFLYSKIQNHSIESSDFAFINRLLKIKAKDDFTYIQKCLMLCSVFKSKIDKTGEEKYKGILYNSYRDLNYTKFHKEVFETKSNRIELKPDFKIINEPSINY